MKDTLKDLFAHQAWADAAHWRAVAALPAALEDPAARQRLHHIHVVQRGFLALARGEAPRVTKLEDFESLSALRTDNRRYHSEAAAFLAAVGDARLGERLVVPWFEGAPNPVTVGEALLQSAMHSHYHRGQNAARLRELGGSPPVTDLIVWLVSGRPAPDWD
jgi:uncharacterized damage-inducible protein DinB